MTRIFLLIGFAAFMNVGCNPDKQPERRKNDITKVCFATGGCYGQCPFLAIEIDSALTYKFYGGKYADTSGFFTGKVSRDFWDTLNFKFEQINYKQLDTSYEHSVDDISTETILYFDNQRKHIHAQEVSLPDSVMRVLFWLAKTYKVVPLKKVADSSITFETRIQNPPPIIMETVKFVPPTEEK